MVAGLPKVCVILGAGASWDVANEGSHIKAKEWRPPLAKQLFNVRDPPQYEAILERYKGAQSLAALVAPKISNGMIGVEQELTKYARHPNRFQLRGHFKQVPPYLRDLIKMCSDHYTEEPGCYNQLITALLDDQPHEALFIVLNYDDLLEAAFRHRNPEHHFHGLDDYVTEDRPAKIVKLHGSIDWFRTFGNADSPWEEELRHFDIFETLPDDEIFIDHEDVTNTKSAQGKVWRFPIVTAPLAGKSLEDVVCPASHVETAREFLAGCNKFLIIGTSGLDEDLFQLLNSAIQTSYPRFVHVVDHGRGAIKLGFPILAVFRLKRQPKRDDGMIFGSCRASQSPVYPIRDAILAVSHASCPSLSSSGPPPMG